jgi:zinc transport system permease protein
MNELHAFFTEPLLRPVLLAGILASILCGALGTFVVLRRLTFLSGGLSHAAFGGLGVCHFLGWAPQLGALSTAAVAALVLGPMERERARSQDAFIGVLWAVGMAVGMLFLHLTPGYPPDLGAYLFGSILLVGPRELWILAAVDAVVLLALLLFFKEMVAVTFDTTFAAVQGVPVRLFSTLFLLLVGAAVVALLPVVGLLLVLALLTIPPLISLRLFRGLRAALVGAIAVGIVLTVGGLALAFLWDVPPGPAIILLGAVLLGVTYGWGQFFRR